MLGLGTGAILGSLAFGRITDACSTNTTIAINLIATTIGHGILILYCSLFEFSFPLAILMTFSFGVQDGGVNCLLQALLGFQFTSKTTPFSVYTFFKSLSIFLCICLESLMDNRVSWLAYFVACYLVAIVAWYILYSRFDFWSEAELKLQRQVA